MRVYHGHNSMPANGHVFASIIERAFRGFLIPPNRLKYATKFELSDCFQMRTINHLTVANAAAAATASAELVSEHLTPSGC